MAGNLETIAAPLDSSKDYLLALVGNFHASRTAPGGLEYMKTAVGYLGTEASTVLLLPTGGESWTCSEGCGAQAVYEPENPDKFVRAAQAEGGFDHVILIGPVTSSPPALSSRGTEERSSKTGRLRNVAIHTNQTFKRLVPDKAAIRHPTLLIAKIACYWNGNSMP